MNRFNYNLLRIFCAVILAFLGASVPVGLLYSSVFAAPQKSHIYVAQWEWFNDSSSGNSYWRAPFGDNIGALDLRTLPDIGKSGGTPQGYGVFVYKEQKTIPGSLYLGTDLNATLTSAQKTDLESKFGITGLISNTPLEFMWDMHTEYSDASGKTGVKPLRSRLGETVQLKLGGFSVIREEPFAGKHIDRTIAVFQEDYKRNKKNGVPIEKLQKWTAHAMKDIHGKMDDATARKILPPDHKRDGWKKPETTVTDDFNRADEELNAGSWVENSGDFEVVSNQVKLSADAAGSNARYTTALSTDDHYSQIDYVSRTNGHADAAIRFSTDANAARDYYIALVLAASIQFIKTVDGADTVLDSDQSVTLSLPDELKIQADGSSMKTFFNGTLEHDFTDTSITGNLQVGIGLRRDDDILDNFEAADVGTGPAWSSGKAGNGGALDFDGTYDYVDLGNLGGTIKTIAFWMKADDATDRKIIDIDGADYIEVDSSSDISAVSFPAATVYVDGVQKTAVDTNWHFVAITDSTGVSPTDMDIGAHDIGGTPGYFDGLIDEVRIYNRAITEAEVRYLYNKGGPIAHYKMDEGSGTTAFDSTNITNDGTITGSTWVAGQYGTALDLDGSDDVVTVTNADPIDFDVGLKTAVTFSAWINADSDGENNVGEIIDKGSATFLRVDTETSGKLDLQASLDLATADATLNVSSALNTNQWHHVAMVYEDDGDDEISLYVDGVNVGVSTDGDGAPASTDTNNLLIGGDTAANFDGTIDDVRVYGYARTADEIRLDYNAGVGAHFR